MKYFINHGIPHRIFSALFPILLVALALTGCSTPPKNEGLSATGFYFDTVVTLQVWGTNDEEILNHCMKLCTQYEQKLSRTIEGSDIWNINHAQGNPVTVSDETIQVLEAGLSYSQLSEGRFDITIASLSILWDIDNNPGTIPEQSAIEEARSHVNYQTVQISGNTVTLTDPNAAIDLGGIAKGYIADQLKAYLKDQGIEHAWISLGGNVVTIGTKIDGSPFRIGIQKPFAEENTAITTLEVTDQSVVSSGIYERYFEKDGKIYHHILDPATGYPCETDLYGVTILSKKSVDGDGYSTICLSLGLKEGLKFINQQDGIEAIFITSDYKLHYSDGLKDLN